MYVKFLMCKSRWKFCVFLFLVNHLLISLASGGMCCPCMYMRKLRQVLLNFWNIYFIRMILHETSYATHTHPTRRRRCSKNFESYLWYVTFWSFFLHLYSSSFVVHFFCVLDFILFYSLDKNVACAKLYVHVRT